MAQSTKKIAEYEKVRIGYLKDCQKPSSAIKELEGQILSVNLIIDESKEKLGLSETSRGRMLQMKR